MRTTVTTLTFATQSEEMEYLYSNKNKIKIRSPFVYKSIANYMKDKVFPTVKFWADSDVKFTEPNFGKTVPANKKKQARRIRKYWYIWEEHRIWEVVTVYVSWFHFGKHIVQK